MCEFQRVTSDSDWLAHAQKGHRLHRQYTRRVTPYVPVWSTLHSLTINTKHTKPCWHWACDHYGPVTWRTGNGQYKLAIGTLESARCNPVFAMNSYPQTIVVELQMQ